MASRVASRRASFVPFTSIAAIGWLIDCALYLWLTLEAHLPPFTANLVSSAIASALVFSAARQALFQKAPRWGGTRLLAYVAYTLLVIVAASVLIQALSPRLSTLLSSFLSSTNDGAAILLSKIFVTPPQLLLNFFVARKLSEATLSVGRSAND
ncbi:GtrA family protein [Phyllobacterium sp. K27]